MCYQKKYSKEKNNLPLFSEIMVGITIKIKDTENKAFKKCIMSEIAVCFLHCSFNFIFKIKNYA